jgi:hypothetical protein
MEIFQESITKKYNAVAPQLNECGKRLWAASEAIFLGRGGMALVSKAIGMSVNTIKKGIGEIETGLIPSLGDKLRIPGGGRKSAIENDPLLAEHLNLLIEPLTRADPMTPLRWTCKSTRVLASELKTYKHYVSHVLVYNLLLSMGYSLKGNSKTLEGSQHPLRNEQFMFINGSVMEQLDSGNPVISVDTKKKEVLGNFANVGKEWEPKGVTTKVNSHDFPSPELDRALPYGVLDLGNNFGFVNIGVDHDTAAFAVASIRAWWNESGYFLYKKCNHLLITADGGGSNSSRSRLWKWELQALSNELGIPVSVCHFPPGTSKWNKIEHRLFSFITRNWRARPLTDYETIINLIRNTKTDTGLIVKCQLDKTTYETGLKVGKKQFASINLKRNEFQGDWNYKINPN